MPLRHTRHAFQRHAIRLRFTPFSLRLIIIDIFADAALREARSAMLDDMIRFHYATIFSMPYGY